MTARFAKIAISLPADDLLAADELARAHDRSRSWIIAEALRRYVAEHQQRGTSTLDPSRREQLRRDLSLSAAERLREAQDVVAVRHGEPVVFEQPRLFATYDDFAAWRRTRLSP